MKKILKKINCEKMFTPKPVNKGYQLNIFLHGRENRYGQI